MDRYYSMSKQLLFVRNNRFRRDLLKYFVSLQRKSQQRTLMIHQDSFGIRSIRAKGHADSDRSSVSIDSRESSEEYEDVSITKSEDTFPTELFWAESGVGLTTIRSEAETNPSLEMADSNLTMIERSSEIKHRNHRRQFSNTEELGSASMYYKAHKQSLDYSGVSLPPPRRKKKGQKTPTSARGDDWMFIE